MDMLNSQSVGYVIQARLGSQRLPGKALLYFRGTTIIGHIVKELRSIGITRDAICVATSTSPFDDALASYLSRLDCNVIRGPEADVFSRFQEVARILGYENIVRLTGDNPLVNLDLVQHCVARHLQSKPALTSTRRIEGEEIYRFVPKGLSVDVINSECLLSVDSSSLSEFEKEHVIPVFFNQQSVELVNDYEIQEQGVSVDTIEDYVRLLEFQLIDRADSKREQ